MAKQIHDAGGAMALAAKSTGLSFGLLLAYGISLAINPPKTKLEVLGFAAGTWFGMIYLGAIVIDLLSPWLKMIGVQQLSIESRTGISVICGGFAWMLIQVLAKIVRRWKVAKNPVVVISEDAKRVKK